jgi:recombinational DNA repair protein (RecF pathway)
MHHIYHTEGIILSSKNFGEAGKYYSIFTRDLGLIHARAQGVRKLSSKLRFVLQDFAYLKIDLVAGREIFRVTNASKTNVLEQITKKPETLKVFSNIARLLVRLLAGVEPNEALFVDLLHGLTLLEKIQKKEPARNATHSVAGGDLRNIEAIIVLRILHNLGYIGDEDSVQNFIKSPFEENIIFELSKGRTQVLQQINKALKETHL